MLQLRNKCDVIIEKCFAGDKMCQRKMKESFEEAINKDTRGASYLASYVDELLKGSLKPSGSQPGTHIQTDTDLEDTLDKCLILFRYLRDKDIFEEYARGHLSKRLLTLSVGNTHSSSSAQANRAYTSEDGERVLISKLKSECGTQFTSKMEGMLLDVCILGKELMEAYKQTHMFRECPIEIDVQTLTQSHWNLKPPSHSQSGSATKQSHNKLSAVTGMSVNVCLPASIIDVCGRFQSFYSEKFKTGRRLQWLTHLGSADVKVWM
jgi:cullin 3